MDEIDLLTLAVVDADDGANHLGNDDDRSKMGLDASGLGAGLVGVNSSLRLKKIKLWFLKLSRFLA